LDKKPPVFFSGFSSLAVVGGAVNLLFSARNTGDFCSRAGEVTALVGGEAGGLKRGAEEPSLLSEDME